LVGGGGGGDKDGSGCSTPMATTPVECVDDVSAIDVQDRLGVPTGVVRAPAARTYKGHGWAVPDHVLEKLQELKIQPNVEEPGYTANRKRERKSGGDEEVKCLERSGKRVRSVDDVFGDMLTEWCTVLYEDPCDTYMETLSNASGDALFASCLLG